MAVVYFTSNASTGAGSLSEAIQNARPGDIVRPDETVFERGATIEIALASQLNVNKDLTLDASPFRISLNGGGAVRCLYIAEGATVRVAGFDFVSGSTTSSGGGIYVADATEATFERCAILGCLGKYGGGAYAAGTAKFYDCLIAGCKATIGGGLSSIGATTVNGSTVAGCVASEGAACVRVSGGSFTATNSIFVGVVVALVSPVYSSCVVGVASSEIGFVASPPDDLTPETWDANAWRSWDLRLLDDASGAPSPYRDSGDVGEMSQYDLQGNFRGRETNGVSTCSPGAYETIQSDLFWIGKDATGAEVASPSWFASDGWAASRFATVSGDKAPQSSDSVFIGDAIVLEGATLRLKKLVVGGGASLTFDDSANDAASTASAGRFDLGVGATVARVGDKQRLQISNASLVSRFGDYCYVDALFFWNNAEALRIAPTAKFGSVASSVKLYADGIYNSYNLQISDVASIEGDSTGCLGVYVSFQTPTARIVATGSPRIVCRSTSWAPPTGATSDFTGLADGSTPIIFAPSRSSTVAGLGSANDFVVDVSNAEIRSSPLALKLTGQTVYGVAPTGSAVALSGSAKVDERGLDVASLTLNADATLTVDGGSVCVETLNAAGAALTVNASTLTATTADLTAATLLVNGGKVRVETLNVANGANVAFSGTDATLAVSGSATVGAATFCGAGYFATPQGTDVSAATFETSVRRVDWSAGVADFTATATGPTTAKLEWSATDETARVCVERENAAAPNGWEVVAITPTEDASPLEVALRGKERFRIFDGQTFYVDEAYFPTGDFYVYVADDISAVATVAVEWETATQLISAGNVMYRNENVLLLASVKNKMTAAYLSRDEVESATATVYAVSPGFGAREIWSPVDGWENIDVPLDAILEEPVEIDGWTLDAVGPNFVWTPDAATRPLFDDSGTFAIQVCVKRKSGGNPIYFTFRAVVK